MKEFKIRKKFEGALIMMTRCLLILAMAFLVGCATLPKDFSATPSTAISQDENTALKLALQPSLTAHEGQSGFYLLDEARTPSSPGSPWPTPRKRPLMPNILFGRETRPASF
jgi:hypothetical protein